jgi:hypothetical protein
MNVRERSPAAGPAALGLRVFAQCFAVLVIVGLASGWFRPYGTTAKAAAKPRAPRTTTTASPSPTATKPTTGDVADDPLQSWEIGPANGSAVTVTVTLIIEAGDIPEGSACERELAQSLKPGTKLRIDSSLYHDESKLPEETLILGANKKLQPSLPSCDAGAPPAFGTREWQVSTEAVRGRTVHLIRTAELDIPTDFDCSGLHVWIPTQVEPAAARSSELRFTSEDENDEPLKSLEEACRQ